MRKKTKVFTFQGESPERLDRCLLLFFPEISRSYLQEIILNGHVCVNGKKTEKKGTMVFPNDQVEIEDFIRPEERTISPNLDLSIDLVHEDQHYALVRKAAGIASHPNHFDDDKTLANWVIGQFPQSSNVGEDALRPGIVHRLDTFTSGLMIVAKTQEGFEKFRSLFDQRLIKKKYMALVVGQTPEKGEIDFKLAHHPRNPRKMVALVHQDIAYRSRVRNAMTSFQCMSQNQKYSLLLVKTLTGRMHQVRVHMSALGFPLVGDELYQDTKAKQMDRLGLKRHFLHASAICFVDPWSQEEKKFSDDLTPELKKCLGQALLKYEFSSEEEK